MDELPDKPELISPKDGEADGNKRTHLQVKVTDPTNDDYESFFLQRIPV